MFSNYIFISGVDSLCCCCRRRRRSFRPLEHTLFSVFFCSSSIFCSDMRYFQWSFANLSRVFQNCIKQFTWMARSNAEFWRGVVCTRHWVSAWILNHFKKMPSNSHSICQFGRRHWMHLDDDIDEYKKRFFFFKERTACGTHRNI